MRKSLLKLKIKLQHPLIICSIISFILGLFPLSYSVSNLLRLEKGPIPLEEVDFTDDIDGLYVTGTIYKIYDCYSYSYSVLPEQKMTSKKYIIDAGDYHYMGLDIKDEGIEKSDSLMNATAAYLSGENDGILLSDVSFTVTGIIKKMPDDFAEFYHQTIDWENLGPQTRQLYLPYYIDTQKPSSENSSIYMNILLISGVFFLCGFFGLAYEKYLASLNGRYNRAARKYLRENAPHDFTSQDILNFIRMTPHIHELRYNEQFISDIYDGHFVFGEAKALVWVYKSIPAHSAPALVFFYANGTKQVMEAETEAIIDEHIHNLQALCPQALFGYNPKLDALFHNNLNAFLHLHYDSYQKR